MATGFSDVDARTRFDRERRRRALSSIAARLRFEPSDVSEMLPFEEVVAALGRQGQRDLGVQSIPLDSVVGTVDRRPGQFDRAFRPVSTDVRGRWERIAAARRRGESLPAIQVYRIGELHFVLDGHHRVSVARALGDSTIDARVIDVYTKLGAGRELQLGDLPLKQHERIFFERVPLPPAARRRIQFKDEWRYAALATRVEAWGFRVGLARGLMSRAETARAWFQEEFEPVVAALNEAGIGGDGTDAERFLRIVMLRDILLHTLEWTDDAVERLAGEVRPPSAEDDTMVHKILTELE